MMLSGLCIAQRTNLDSLLVKLRTDKLDTFRVSHQNQISSIYHYAGQSDSAMYYANCALQTSDQLLKDAKDTRLIYTGKWGKAVAYTNIANVLSERKGLYCSNFENFSPI